MNVRLVAWCLAASLALAPQLGYAVQPDEMMADAAKEARARALSQELRCMVCQNQSIDDSDAPLARDLRILVRERIAQGESDAQVIDFIVARYGAFVLLKPPFNTHTLLLWLLPPAVLVLAAIALWMRARLSSKSALSASFDPPPLHDNERVRLAELQARERAADNG